MPPKASAAEKGKRKRGAEGDVAPLATLLARLSRADLEALLLRAEPSVGPPALREQVLELLAPAKARLLAPATLTAARVALGTRNAAPLRAPRVARRARATRALRSRRGAMRCSLTRFPRPNSAH